MTYIITSRTRRLYGRVPSGRMSINPGSRQAQNLVCFWPMNGSGILDQTDIIKGTVLTAASAMTQNSGPDGSLSLARGGNLVNSSPPITGTPLSFAGWVFPTNNALNSILIEISTDVSNWFTLEVNGQQIGDPIRAGASQTGGAFYAATSVGYSLNIWQHVCGIFAANNNRAVYLNGGNKATNSSTRNPSTATSLSVGYSVPLSQNFNGNFTHICAWNRALTDTEVYQLYDPPTRWELYYPLGKKLYSFAAALTNTDI